MLYYRNGDSISFFTAMKPLYGLAFNDPASYLSFIFNFKSRYPMECFFVVDSQGVGYILNGSASLSTIRVGSLINLFCFNSYIACSVVIAFLSYLLIWRTFRLFVSIYPMLEKQFALGFLMVPSLIFWGSGVGKDSIMLSCIMAIFASYYYLVIRKQRMVSNAISLIIAASLMSMVRGFLLFTILPSLILMTAIYYKNAFKSPLVRFVALPLFMAGGLGASFFFIKSMGNSINSYSLDSLQQTAQGFQSWHQYLGETQGGSAYSLGGDLDYSVGSIIKKAPIAMVISLFGPFVWQIRNAVMLMSGVESLAFLYFFVTTFLNMRAYRALGILGRDHVVMFCIPFIIIIAIAVGLTSFNYGALVRYRIPILPFFVALLAITSYRIRQGSKS